MYSKMIETKTEFAERTTRSTKKIPQRYMVDYGYTYNHK